MSTILVVDDEDEIRSLLAEHFGEQGYAVREAVDGEDALQCVRRDRPDLVLLDIRLPGMDGIEVLRRIRREDPGIGVVMITGHKNDALLRSALEAGALDCFQKPFDLPRLDRTVRSGLDLFASPTGRGWLAITVQAVGNVTVVALQGNLDAGDAERLKRVLGDLLADGQSRLVVDLSDVVYMDSRGLGALVAAMKQAQAAGGDLKLCGLHGDVRSIFEMTGLIERMPVHESRDAAITSLTPGRASAR